MATATHSIPSDSPFDIPLDDMAALAASPGFQVLQHYLADKTDNSFCEHHSAFPDTHPTWLLHRDLLHALNMPVLQLFRRASALAHAALCTQKPEDLELAFHGDARSAFLWLQCFVTDEVDWCCTRGCPACVTAATISTESHIRLTVASSLLSISPASSAPSDALPISEPAGPTTPSGLSLPPLPHILPALREALAQDPFWGPEYWPYLLSRANSLSAGIQALIRECGELEALVSSPSPTSTPSEQRAALLRYGGLHGDGEGSGTKLKKSKLAKRQLRMKGEELELLQRAALQCWGAVAVPAALRKQTLGRVGERRVRSLTCP
ncbi:hypothetical protein BU16DRAFT_574354 [Lophium mytilinum]|uniref:Uncharacterized protein n=1 Tax=Lophium mytilinum TaxID=390894 RepID=A0A6A6QJE2_9PEZI|nr:hypothetical protein BU16DRAFT_574354 [Lophium mytilinum]